MSALREGGAGGCPLYSCEMNRVHLSRPWRPSNPVGNAYGAVGLLVFLIYVVALLSMAPQALAADPSAPAISAAALHVVDLTAQSAGTDMTGAIGVLVDDSAALTIDDVRGTAVQQRFRWPATHVRTGVDPRPYWLRIDVRQKSGSVGEWLLEVPSVAAYELQFHGPFDVHGRQLGPVAVTGIAHPYASRALGAERMVFRFRLEGDGPHTLYLRAVSNIGQIYALKVWELGDYLASTRAKQLFDGFCYGVLMLALLYNFVLWTVLRDHLYSSYLAVCLSGLLAIASLNGHLLHYVIDRPAWLAELIYTASSAIWVACVAYFCRQFLELPSRAPGLARVMTIFIAVMLGGIILGPAGHPGWLVILTQGGAVTCLLLVLLGAMAAIRSGHRLAILFLSGVLSLGLPMLLVILSNWGVVPWASSNLNLLQIGVVAELVVFSLALGLRLRGMRRSNTELGAHARAMALAAGSDPLTGVYNRAGLVERAAQLLLPGQSHAVVLIDLDDFKPVNDRWGHDVGDQVLVKIARRLQKCIRPGDVVARIGGDEFVLVLADLSDRNKAVALVERVLASLRQPMACGDALVNIEASAGVAHYPDNGTSLPALIRAADVAMYRAKSSEERRVVLASTLGSI
ncbi:MAG: hypothetical protein JWQ03_1181 [Variovorax sp.]|nr:hypothetical protein [Variovorax sp.]